MSPTCTIPYEVLFEFANNTAHPATMQVLRRDDGSRTGATIYIHRGENLSLVLTAGVPYKYSVKQHVSGREVNVSVKVWHDTVCNLADVFSPPKSAFTKDGTVTIADGLLITPAAGHTLAYR